jgi:hypothetical protein
MLKSTAVPGTGTNFIPRLFTYGCFLVAAATAFSESSFLFASWPTRTPAVSRATSAAANPAFRPRLAVDRGACEIKTSCAMCVFYLLLKYWASARCHLISLRESADDAATRAGLRAVSRRDRREVARAEIVGRFCETPDRYDQVIKRNSCVCMRCGWIGTTRTLKP